MIWSYWSVGLTIDSKLNYSKYIQTTTHNASLKLNALWWLSKWLDPEVRLDYGQIFVLGKFSYCPWSGTSVVSYHDNIMLNMANVQKQLLWNVYEYYESCYGELFLKSKLSILEMQRYWLIATEGYKAVNKNCHLFTSKKSLRSHTLYTTLEIQ